MEVPAVGGIPLLDSHVPQEDLAEVENFERIAESSPGKRALDPPDNLEFGLFPATLEIA